MLNKRTHILFDHETFFTLQLLAQQQNTSIGDLVRNAVRQTYTDGAEIEWERKKQAFEALKQWRMKPVGTRINYKQLIDDGRKY